MFSHLRHAIRVGMGLVAVGLVTGCVGEARRDPDPGAAIATTPAAPVAPAIPASPAALATSARPTTPTRDQLARTVYFEYKNPSLGPEALREIDKWILFLKADEHLTVTLTGHTDSRGSREDNRALGMQRATEVRRALVRGGIAKQRISVRSRGEFDPQVYGRDEFAMTRNRRVEIDIN